MARRLPTIDMSRCQAHVDPRKPFRYPFGKQCSRKTGNESLCTQHRAVQQSGSGSIRWWDPTEARAAITDTDASLREILREHGINTEQCLLGALRDTSL